MDVHKDTIVVYVLPPVGIEKQGGSQNIRTFRNELIRMRVWLKQLKVTEVAMESTGVYWRPVWNVLEEEGFRPAGESGAGKGTGWTQERWTRCPADCRISARWKTGMAALFLARK